MTDVKLWNVEISTLNESNGTTEWRKIGVNLMWYQVLEIRSKYKPFITRYHRANNTLEPTCNSCGAHGGHWLSCESQNVLANTKLFSIPLKQLVKMQVNAEAE